MTTHKFRASWWWIDRWRKSTAYSDMTLAEQGAYRNLLDELWLRDGVLPADERILAKISGGPFEWHEVRDAVLARFILTDDGYRNETHDEVAAQTKTYREAQSEAAKKRWKGVPKKERSAAAKKAADARWNASRDAEKMQAGTDAECVPECVPECVGMRPSVSVSVSV